MIQNYILILILDQMKRPNKSKTLNYYRWLKNNIFSLQSKNLIKKNHALKLASKCYKKQLLVIQQNQFTQYTEERNHLIQKPLKIILNNVLNYNYPDKIVVRIQKKQELKGLDQIDYRFDNQNVIYLEVPADEYAKGNIQNKYGVNNGDYSISVPQMTLHKQNYQIPQFVHQYYLTKNGIYSVNLWHYKKQTLTKWHYDAHDNFLFQLKGSKLIHLYPPNSIKTISKKLKQQNSSFKSNKKQNFIYINCDSVFDIDNNHQNIKINSFNIDQNKIKVKIKQNQCLFIPRGWFHKVSSQSNCQGDNIALNFWGNTIQSYRIPTNQRQINLKNMIFQTSEQICRQNVQNWNQIQEKLKKQFRKAYFYKYLHLLNIQT